MPYIEYERRKAFDFKIDGIVKKLGGSDFSPGELNYCLSRIIWRLWDDGIPSYEKANRLIGILECVKQEFYRRQVAPYEDEKLEDNGDIV